MFKWGLRSRLTISYLVLILFSMLIAGSYILWFFYRYTLDEMATNLFKQAQITEQLLQSESTSTSNIRLDNQIKALTTKISLHITIVNSTGAVLADSVHQPTTMENQSHLPEIKEALSGIRNTDMRYDPDANMNWLYAAIPWQKDNETVGAIRLATSISNIETGFNKIQSALLAAWLLASLVTIILSLRLSRKFIAPLESITEIAQQYASGNFNNRLHIKTGDEIELLAHTLNNLAGSLDDKVNEIVAEKRKLEIILQHMDNAVIVVDRFGRLNTANQMANSLFCIKAHMIGLHNIQVIGNSILDRAIRHCVDTAHSNVIDLKTNYKNNKRVFQVFIAPIFDTGQDVTSVLCVFHDITSLQAIYERQADFVANASHELATPLTAIKGFAETLLDGALQDPLLSKKFVEIIYNESDRMHRLVKDLLQLAKLDSTEYRQHITLEPTDATIIIQQVIDELMPHWQRKQLTVIFTNDEGPIFVQANYDWLKQVFVNLIENAIKYTSNSGKLSIEYKQDSNNAIFTIEDTGSGIEAKDLPLIFDRFYRVDRSRTRSAGGTGLGLAIVKFIVESFNGSINVKSELHIGTIFTVILPLANPPK